MTLADAFLRLPLRVLSLTRHHIVFLRSTKSPLKLTECHLSVDTGFSRSIEGPLKSMDGSLRPYSAMLDRKKELSGQQRDSRANTEPSQANVEPFQANGAPFGPKESPRLRPTERWSFQADRGPESAGSFD